MFVVGEGYAAAEESIFLTKFARHVTILIREKNFTCAEAVAEEARNHKKITVLTYTVVGAYKQYIIFRNPQRKRTDSMMLYQTICSF